MKAQAIDIFIENSVAPHRAMEIDLELLSQYRSTNTTAFRLYHWARPTISLGRLQQKKNILDESALEQDGISLVTRPSGGRHVLHGEDISFSFVIPSKNVHFWGSKVSERSRSIASFFQSVLNTIGVSLEIENGVISRSSMIETRKSACFLTTAQNELTVNGKKIIGIAQLVAGDAVLIQGTMPLTSHYRTITKYQRGTALTREHESLQLSQKTVPLDEVLPEHHLCFEYLTNKIVENIRKSATFAIHEVIER